MMDVLCVHVELIQFTVQLIKASSFICHMFVYMFVLGLKLESEVYSQEKDET